jgi:hypothetical protein
MHNHLLPLMMRQHGPEGLPLKIRVGRPHWLETGKDYHKRGGSGGSVVYNINGFIARATDGGEHE